MRHWTKVLLVFILSSSASAQQPVFYGSTSFPNDPSGGRLGIIDQNNGAFAPLPWDPTAEGLMPAIAFDSKGYLWGSENKDNFSLVCPGRSGRCGHLIKINPTNGSKICECEAFRPPTFGGMRITDMSFQPGTDVLFGLDTTGSLYIIHDPCLGDETPGPEELVGPTGLDRGGLAFSPDGRLWVASVSGQLAEIDPLDGSVMGPVMQMANGIEGIAFRPTDGVLFGTGDDAREIYKITTTTGAQTLVVQDNGVYTAGLAFTPLHHLYFAQFGAGGDIFSSDVVVASQLAGRPIEGHVDFFDDSGAPMPIEILNGNNLKAASESDASPQAQQTSVNFSTDPRDSTTIATDNTGDLKVGSAVVTSDGPLGGVVRFKVSLFDLGIAGVGTSEPLRHFITPVRRKAGGINTGVAMQNTGDTTIKITLKLLQNGQQVGIKVLDDFPAKGHIAKFIDEFFDTVDTDDFVGTLEVEVEGGKVAATALEQGSSAGEFTTLPVAPLP